MNKGINSWNLPFILLILASALLGFKYTQLTAARKELLQVETKAAAAEEAVKRESESTDQSQTRIAIQSKDEESAFVNDLRMRAVRNNIAFVRWQSSPPELPKPTEGSSQPVQGVRVIPLKANVEFEGQYADIRTVISDLMSGPRYVIIENATWDRVDLGAKTKLAVTIVRFVTPDAGPTTLASTTSGHGGSR